MKKPTLGIPTPPMTQFILKLCLFAGLGWIPLGDHVFAAESAPCETLLKNIESRKTRQSSIRHVIEKNNQYLVKNTEASTSIKIKIRSNLLMGNLLLETLSNELLALENDVKSKGCKK